MKAKLLKQLRHKYWNLIPIGYSTDFDEYTVNHERTYTKDKGRAYRLKVISVKLHILMEVMQIRAKKLNKLYPW